VQKNSYRLGDLAELLGAQLQGDPEYRIDGLAKIENAQGSDITFVSGKAYLKYLAQTAAGAVLLRPEWSAEYSGNCLLLKDPYWGYARLSGLFSQRPNPMPGIHPTAVVSESATIAPSASIGAHCVVEAEAVIGGHTELAPGVFVGARTMIGENCRLYPNVTIYHDISIGNAVTIHSATVIGSDGFGFAPSADGWEKIHQLGGVVIGNNVEIGSGCTLDRGALSDTVIEQGVIIDNQVHIAHNVRIGEFTAIAGCCGIAGSTEIGAHCLLGGSVNISGHLKIADHVQFNGASVVTKSIREPGTYSSGTPLQPARQWQKNAVRFGHLNDLFDRVKKIEDGESQAD
jgi:UDP-3-O-[3-hydroxymyristoyl] glucosamine N-acyltransferase